MSIDLFSRRNAPPCKQLIYDEVKVECRQQITNIATGFFQRNHADGYAGQYIWPLIRNTLRDEHGTSKLYPSLHDIFGGEMDASEEVKQYLLNVEDIGKLLDTIEFLFLAISRSENVMSNAGYPVRDYTAVQAIEDLNNRLAQHCIGYKYEGEMLMRIDNELLYSSITKELMVFLSDPLYQTINAEYLQAHKHFRGGDYQDCIVNAAKAFESTMKVICTVKRYVFNQNDAAAKLLQVLYDNKFVPTYLQNNLSGLRSVLGDGVSVIRNKSAAHGAGAQPGDVSEGLTAFSLNSAGSAIKFLLTVLEGK